MIRRLARNSAKLLGGNGLAALLNLVALSLAARSLGPADLGAYALLTGYVTLISGLVNPNAGQGLIKFGADARRDQDEDKVTGYVRMSLTIDIVAMGLAACLAAACGPLALDLLNLPQDYLPVLLALSMVIVFQAQGTFIGLLRLDDDFSPLFSLRPIAAGLLLAGFGILSTGDHGAGPYVLVYGASEMAAALYLIFAASCHLHRLRLGGWRSIATRLSQSERSSFLRFILWGKGSEILEVVPRSADVLIVGAILGDAGAGLYRVARLLAQVPAIFQAPLFHAIYPQIAELAAGGKSQALRHLALFTSFGAGSISAVYWLLAVFIGKQAVVVLFGASYAGVWMTAVILLAGFVVAGLAVPLAPVALSAGRPDILLKTSIVSVSVYTALAAALLSIMGLPGIGIATLVFYLVHASLMLCRILPLEAVLGNRAGS